MGRPRKFEKTELITFRLLQSIADKLPRGGHDRADFLREAVAEKIAKKELDNPEN